MACIYGKWLVPGLGDDLHSSIMELNSMACISGKWLVYLVNGHYFCKWLVFLVDGLYF